MLRDSADRALGDLKNSIVKVLEAVGRTAA
jgi:hypothetical protein